MPNASNNKIGKPRDVTHAYSQVYLNQYWPEFPGSPSAWADNAVLMLAYQEAALAVSKYFNGSPAKTLDVSTGPTLAPLLAMITCISDVQLSDFEEDNRQCLINMPIDYWRNYVQHYNNNTGTPILFY